MTFDEFIQALGIIEAEAYTYIEVADMMELSPSTIEAWCHYGLKTRAHGPVVLQKFNRGRRIWITGKALIEFLRLTQNNF